MEMHHEYRNLAKNIVEKCKPTNVWILYMNDISYYSSSEFGNKFVSGVNELSRSYVMSILNIFMNLTNSEKINMKKYLKKFIRHKLTNLTYKCQPEFHKPLYDSINIFSNVSVKLNSTERFIYDKYLKIASHSKNLLSINRKNSIEQSDLSSIDSTICQSFLNIISSTTNSLKYIHSRHKIINLIESISYQQFLNHITNIEKKIIKEYSTSGNSRTLERETEQLHIYKDKYMKKITDGIERCKKIDSRGTVVESSCMICYTDVVQNKNQNDNLEDDREISESFIYTLCGHVFCVDCFMNSYMNKSDCPMCNYFINSKKVILVQKAQKSEYVDMYNKIVDISNVKMTITMFDIFRANTSIIFYSNDKKSFDELRKFNFDKISEVNVLLNKSKKTECNILLSFLYQISLFKKDINIVLFSIKDFH